MVGYAILCRICVNNTDISSEFSSPIGYKESELSTFRQLCSEMNVPGTSMTLNDSLHEDYNDLTWSIYSALFKFACGLKFNKLVYDKLSLAIQRWIISQFGKSTSQHRRPLFKYSNSSN